MAAEGLRTWRAVQSTSSKTIMVKSNFNEEKCSYQVDIYDGSKLWREAISRDEFCMKCKELNPKVEADYSYLFNQIKCSFENLDISDNNKLDLVIDDVQCKIYFRIKLKGGIPFFWTFDLSEDPSSLTISKEMILPLLSMIGELMQQRKDLFNIISRKDNEIQDYRDQGVVASRKSLETTRIESSKYLEDRPSAKDYLELVEDPLVVFSEESCQRLYRHALEERRRMGESRGPTSLLTKPIERNPEELKTQAIDATFLEPPLPSEDNQGDEMKRRRLIASKLAGKAGDTKAKKKRKNVNL